MKISATLPDHGEVVEAVLEGFTLAACLIIESGVVPPFPQQTTVKYSEEPAGQESWLLPNQVMAAGVGDCEDLCIWEAAGMRVTGEDPGAKCVLAMTGKKKLHCLVMMSDGRVSDPSMQLSMRQKQLAMSNFSVGGGVTITDHRKPPSSQPPPTGGPPPAQANPNPTDTSNSPFSQLTKWMKDNANNPQVKHNSDGSTSVSFTDEAFLQAHGVPKGLNTTYNPYQDKFDAALGPMAQGLANAAAVGDVVSAHFGQGQRTNAPPEGYVQDPVTGQWYPPGAGVDPLAEMPMYPQAPWGGGYGSDYGYGGDYGYGQFQGGYGGVGPGYYQDAPLLTYMDLYGASELMPDDRLYTEGRNIELLDMQQAADAEDGWFEGWL
jgi:hypothetical protein